MPLQSVTKVTRRGAHGPFNEASCAGDVPIGWILDWLAFSGCVNQWQDVSKHVPVCFAKKQKHGTKYHERRKKKRSTEVQVCEDNIQERTGLEFANSQRAVENRNRWRELGPRSSQMR